MMNEETLNKYRSSNPYKVPENYFENLTAEVMNNIDSKTQNERTGTRRSYFTLWVAHHKKMIVSVSSIAAVLTLILSLNANQFNGLSEKQIAMNNPISETASDSILTVSENDMMEYAMIDGSSVYMYLSGNEF